MTPKEAYKIVEEHFTLEDTSVCPAILNEVSYEVSEGFIEYVKEKGLLDRGGRQ